MGFCGAFTEGKEKKSEYIGLSYTVFNSTNTSKVSKNVTKLKALFVQFYISVSTLLIVSLSIKACIDAKK